MASARTFPLSSTIVAALILVAACAPAAQPSPTAAPSKPAEAAKPAATTAPAKPAEAAKPATEAAKPADKAAPATKVSFAGRTLRVATWGGDWGNGVKTSAGKLFEEQTGGKIEYVLGNPADNLTKLMATRGEPPFDVMQMDNLTEETMIQQNLLEPLDYNKLPVGELFPEASRVTEKYGPAFTMIPAVITWVPKAYKDQGLADPKGFDDLLDPKLKGRVSYPGMRVGFAPLVISGLAYHWTGDKANVGEAMRKLKTIEPRVYGATPEMATWLTNGEVYAAVTHTAQVMVMRNQGFELGLLYPPVRDKRSMVYWNMTNVIKNTKSKDMAEHFVATVLSREAQDLMGRSNGVLPTHKEVAEQFSKDEKLKGLALSPQDMAQMFQVDSKYILDNREKWNDEWNRIMGG
jgi:putative spermidine/putrescine transport system substrate-binding protein